jgi:glutamate-1-semialdehyde 2,1-aminomutase
MPSLEMFRMLASGNRIMHGGDRAAATFTEKAKVIKVGAPIMAVATRLCFGMRIPGSGRSSAHGIPAGCYQNTQEVFPNEHRRA